MSWSDDQTTPSYASRPVLSLRAFLKPSEPPGSSSGIRTPLPRPSGIVPRTAPAVALRTQSAHSQPSAAVSLPSAHRSAAESGPQLKAAPALPARTDPPQPAPLSPARHYPPPLPEAARVAPSQHPPARAQQTRAARGPSRAHQWLQDFALQQLFSDPLVWLGNPQRALLLLAILSSSAVLALLCLGGFLDQLSGP